MKQDSFNFHPCEVIRVYTAILATKSHRPSCLPKYLHPLQKDSAREEDGDNCTFAQLRSKIKSFHISSKIIQISHKKIF